MAFVLLYSPHGNAQTTALRMLLAQLKIKMKTVLPEQAEQKIGFLAGVKGFEAEEKTAEMSIEDSVMILCDFSGNELNDLLRGMKRQGILLPYKAVLTEHNITWTLHYLYEELKSEHEAIEKQKKT